MSSPANHCVTIFVFVFILLCKTANLSHAGYFPEATIQRDRFKLFRPVSSFRHIHDIYTYHGTSTRWPTDFDVAAYLQYNPDVEQAKLPIIKENGTQTKLAHLHFKAFGHAEKRVYSRIPAVVTYVAWGGLCNQIYTHLAAMVIAQHIGADIILPPGLRRRSYADVFTMDKTTSEASYTMTEFSNLFDARRIAHYLEGRGIKATYAPAIHNYSQPNPEYLVFDKSSLYQDHVANTIRNYNLQGVPLVVAEVKGLFSKPRSLQTVRRQIKYVVVKAASDALFATGKYQSKPPVVIIDLQFPLFSLEFQGMPQAKAAMANFGFAPNLVKTADSIIKQITQSYAEFNGLHLRAEKDIQISHNNFGGAEAFREAVLDHCKRVGMLQKQALYVASGLLSYDDQALWEAYKKDLLAQTATTILHKEMYLTPTMLEALDTEQKAVVDFLVLARSNLFVGFALSTFSLMLREYRQLNGLAPRNHSMLMEKSRVVDVSPIIRDLYCKAACLE